MPLLVWMYFSYIYFMYLFISSFKASIIFIGLDLRSSFVLQLHRISWICWSRIARPYCPGLCWLCYPSGIWVSLVFAGWPWWQQYFLGRWGKPWAKQWLSGYLTRLAVPQVDPTAKGLVGPCFKLIVLGVSVGLHGEAGHSWGPTRLFTTREWAQSQTMEFSELCAIHLCRLCPGWLWLGWNWWNRDRSCLVLGSRRLPPSSHFFLHQSIYLLIKSKLFKCDQRITTMEPGWRVQGFLVLLPAIILFGSIS